MGSRLKVLTIFGTRPEAIKLFPLLHAFAADDRFESRVCVSGQHRELLDPVLALAGIVPDHDCAVMRSGQSLDGLTARLMASLGRVIDEECPDILVVQGDTTTAFVGALAAHYRKIPVAHVEAGLRSGDTHNPWPEEFNRRAIAAVATWHFAPTARARDALIAENIPPPSIHVTGNTGIDALLWTAARLAGEPQLARTISPAIAKSWGRRIIAVTCHRRENIGAGVIRIAAAVAALSRRDDIAVIWPVHPNPAVAGPLRAQLPALPNVHLVEPLPYPDFVRLIQTCHFMISDSGGVQEEAPALGKPVLVLRESTERCEGVDAGGAILVGTDTQTIVTHAVRLLDTPLVQAAMGQPSSLYGDGQAAQRIAGVLGDALSGHHQDVCRIAG